MEVSDWLAVLGLVGGAIGAAVSVATAIASQRRDHAHGLAMQALSARHEREMETLRAQRERDMEALRTQLAERSKRDELVFGTLHLRRVDALEALFAKLDLLEDLFDDVLFWVETGIEKTARPPADVTSIDKLTAASYELDGVVQAKGIYLPDHVLKEADDIHQIVWDFINAISGAKGEAAKQKAIETKEHVEGAIERGTENLRREFARLAGAEDTRTATLVSAPAPGEAKA